MEVDRHRRISESTRTPITLVGLWRVFAEKMGRPDLADWFLLHQTKITISDQASRFGDELIKRILSDREGRAQTIKLDELRTLRIERFSPARRSPELPGPIDALFRVIFDYVQDQNDDYTIPDKISALSLWPATGSGSDPERWTKSRESDG